MTTQTLTFTWTEGSRFPGSVEEIGQRVYDLSKKSPVGVCSTVDYVTDAMDPESPLHPTIEWDEKRAAWNWQNHQARRVMNSLRIVVDGRPDPAPAFVSLQIVTDDGVTNGYTLTREIKVQDYREQALEDAKQQMNALRRRFSYLEALKPVWEALDQI